MIRNIIFDLGNVLIPFRPQVYLEHYADNEADRNLLVRATFHSADWVKIDTGDLDIHQAEAVMLANLPDRLHATASKMIYEWPQLLPPFAEMEQLVRELKAKGLHTYLLSNIGRYYYDLRSQIPAVQMMDGEVISADYGIIKPYSGIYRILLRKYNLKPEECFFIDDSPLNIYGAAQVGINGAVFDGDVDALRETLKSLNVL